MFYLIYGPQFEAIRPQQNKIVKEYLYEKDDFNFVRFNAEATPIQDIIEECSYIPLGTDKKVVLIDNCYFFLKPKPKVSVEKDQMYDKFTEYLKHPNDETIAVFSVVATSIDENNEFVKLILSDKATKKIELKDMSKDDFYTYAKGYMANRLQVNITQDALKELVARTEGDLISFKNNAHKLAIYSDNITFKDVCDMVARPLEDNAFQIFNYLIKRQNDSALAVYKDLEVSNTEPVTIISMLANQFRLLNEVSYLAKQGKSDEEIASILGIKPIRAKILRDNSRSMTSARIRQVLDSLYELDSQIKNGLSDRFYAFELFLINFSTY